MGEREAERKIVVGRVTFTAVAAAVWNRKEDGNSLSTVTLLCCGSQTGFMGPQHGQTWKLSI